ncbi:hypothetical protein RsTz2092_02670 [Deferribacterales bacterium RsTz2092]|nr:hypothetical protein AGMMS49941_06880 [Deferribacterales bacterium]
MAIIKAFKPIHYDLEKVLLNEVIAPPYDVISPAERETLLQRSPHNVVSIDLPVGGTDKYERAAETFNKWLAESVLMQESADKFYIYEQEFSYNGKSYVRTGLLGLLKLENFGKGSVYPHEKTLSAPKQDRLELMRATQANFSPIFGLYLDEKNIIYRYKQGLPNVSTVDYENIKHSLWAIDETANLAELQTFMADKSIYIADGHHRYETALTYRDEMRDKDGSQTDMPYDYIMMFFVNFYDPGLLVLPTHRVVDLQNGITPDSLVNALKTDFDVKLCNKEDYLPTTGQILIRANGITHILTAKKALIDTFPQPYRAVDTYTLEHGILKKHLMFSDAQLLAKQGLHFYQELEDVYSETDSSSGAKVGFVLAGLPAETIKEVSENGLVMPQKSTYFYPKPVTGLAFNLLK